LNCQETLHTYRAYISTIAATTWMSLVFHEGLAYAQTVDQMSTNFIAKRLVPPISHEKQGSETWYGTCSPLGAAQKQVRQPAN
jgi:hypothetical protein